MVFSEKCVPYFEKSELKMKTKKYLHILFCAVLAAVLLLVGVFTFLRPIFTMQIPVSGTLSITASGIKNPASAGSEVRIRQIALDGEPVDLATLAVTPGWGLDGELLVAYNVSSLVTLTIPVEQVETLTLATVGQRGSGHLDLTFGDLQESLDLYADSDWEERSQQIVVSDTVFAPIDRIDLLIELWIVCALFVWLAGSKLITGRRQGGSMESTE